MVLVVVVGEGESNDVTNMVSFYDFHQSSLGSNNLTDMILIYDSINRQFHHISPKYYQCYFNLSIGGRKIWQLFAVTL